MHSHETERIRQVAIEASRIGARTIMQEFGHSKVLKQKGLYDIQISADTNSEDRIKNYIWSNFPNHKILAEESQNAEVIDSSDLWVVDPLDGSNNFAYNFPYFGVVISYFRHGIIRLAAIFEPVLEHLYFVEKESNSTLNGHTIHVSERKDYSRANIALVTGYSETGGENRLIMNNELSKSCKRVFTSWAPAMDLTRIASGMFDGMLCWRAMYTDTCAGLLLLERSGGIICDLEGNKLTTSDIDLRKPADFIAASNEAIVEGLLGAHRNASRNSLFVR